MFRRKVFSVLDTLEYTSLQSLCGVALMRNNTLLLDIMNANAGARWEREELIRQFAKGEADAGINIVWNMSTLSTMPSLPAITLYDIPSTLESQAWNPSVWKARLVLNYKHIPYKTEWVSHPDIEAVAKKLGCSPTMTKAGKPIYTMPIIIDHRGGTPVAVCDSLEIAEYLDTNFPDRPVLPKEGKALEHAFEVCFRDLLVQHLTPMMAFPTWQILDDHGKAYYRETREIWFGKKLEEISVGGEREAHWEMVKNGFNKIAHMLEQNGPDVEFMAGGNEPTRADLILVSYLAYIKALTPEEGWVSRVQNWNGGRWQKLWDKSEGWRAVI